MRLYCYIYFSYIQNNHTPLHLAAFNGHADVGNILINAGAHIDALNKVSMYYNVNLLY